MTTTLMGLKGRSCGKRIEISTKLIYYESFLFTCFIPHSLGTTKLY